MYNENNEGSLRKVFFRIVIVVGLLFILMLFFPTKGFLTNYVDKKLSNNTYFNSNLTAMATAASGYYSKSRLPQNEGDEAKMSLKEILDKKLLVKLTDNSGVECSKTKSYVLVKKEKDEYTMKVNLNCGGKEDYIMLHMGLDQTQFPSTSTARCTFVKNLDATYDYGQWSSWSTSKIEEDGTNEVQVSVKSVQTGTKTVIKQDKQESNPVKYNLNNKVKYVCGNEYDNKGVYDDAIKCIKTINIYYDEPIYDKITYYRSRSKVLVSNGVDTKEDSCDSNELINQGYTKVQN